jgi:hypothetical protein
MAYRTRLLLPAAALTLLSAAIGVSCSNRAEDCSEASTCPGAAEGNDASGGDGGADGNASGGDRSGAEGGSGGSDESANGGAAGTDGNGPGSCDAEKSPLEESCLVQEEHAVFVAPDGDDDAAGTKKAPVATLTRAIELAAGEKAVLVCNAVYDEHVVVTASARVYGGFSCEDWSEAKGAPHIEPSDEGFALEIRDVGGAVWLERMTFEVPDASDEGDSAVAAFVRSSPKVTLRGVSLVAGKGAAGKDGELTPFEYPLQVALDGNRENPATMGGEEKSCTCQEELISTGGLGGLPAESGSQGTAGLPSREGPGGEPGTAGAACNKGGGGGDGADGRAAPSAPGATELGSVLKTGWKPLAGGDAGAGQPGQGGGGGASRTISGHGGGGGCGGCGGNGGRGGQGGGGSIALLLVGSPVTLESCSLRAADAGHGGKGAAGQIGQQEVGAGGSSVSTLHSCDGGNGGRGGNGGAGGGGAGGVSAGILWKGGGAPTLTETSIKHGVGGLAGEGGAEGNPGVEGAADAILEL